MFEYFQVNPRNLTLYFDGENLYGAIGHLKDEDGENRKRNWLQCNTFTNNAYGLEFYEYSYFRIRYRSYSYTEKLNVALLPFNTPRGPNYDDECAYFANAFESKPNENVKMLVNVKHQIR